MKTMLLILALLIISLAKAQPNKDKLIQAVYLNFIDTPVQKFNLLETGKNLPLKLLTSFGVVEELYKILPHSTAQSLLENYKSDTSSHYWDTKYLANAILVNEHQADTLVGIVLNAKYAEESKRNYKRRKKELKNKRGLVYVFSNPIFDVSQKFALISASYRCGRGCGSGCFYLLEFKNNSWQILSKSSCWIS